MRRNGPTLLIDDDEIRAAHGEDAAGILSQLDADPATRTYQPYYNGRRYRPAVESKIAEIKFAQALE